MPFLRLIRFPNLVIVALTQYLLQYWVLVPLLQKMRLAPVLPPFEFFLLVVSTVCIAASGYVVNDIEDVDIDAHNKPEHKRVVGRVYPLSTSWRIYWFFVLLGLAISAYLAQFVRDFGQLLIYPAAVFGLFAYSKWWKKQFLIGNLVVAFFCAFVAWVVVYAQTLDARFVASAALVDSDFFTKDFFKARATIEFVFLGYAVFAFVSTLFREIVKDIEDAEGDRVGDCRTLPIVLGTFWSKFLAGLVGVGLLVLTVGFSAMNIEEALGTDEVSTFRILIFNGLVALPTFYALYLLARAKSKKEFAYISKLAKIIMLSGLFFILIMKI